MKPEANFIRLKIKFMHWLSESIYTVLINIYEQKTIGAIKINFLKNPFKSSSSAAKTIAKRFLIYYLWLPLTLWIIITKILENPLNPRQKLSQSDS